MNGKAIGRGVAALGGLACVAVLAWPRLFPPPPPKERELPRSESMMPTSKAAPTPVGSPELRANPEKVEFGDLRLQGVAVRRLVQIVNKGTAAVAVDPPAGLGDEVAIVRQNCGGRTLGPEDSCQLMVEAQPKEVGPFSAQIAFVTRGSVLLTITATGSAVAPPPASSATATAQPVAAAPVTTTSAPAPAKPDPQVLDALARRQERPPRLIRSDRPAARYCLMNSAQAA